MHPTDHIWQNGTFVPWQHANTHVLSHGLHYGSGVFEGIRCYDTKNGPKIYGFPNRLKAMVPQIG